MQMRLQSDTTAVNAWVGGESSCSEYVSLAAGWAGGETLRVKLLWLLLGPSHANSLAAVDGLAPHGLGRGSQGIPRLAGGDRNDPKDGHDLPVLTCQHHRLPQGAPWSRFPFQSRPSQESWAGVVTTGGRAAAWVAVNSALGFGHHGPR